MRVVLPGPVPSGPRVALLPPLLLLLLLVAAAGSAQAQAVDLDALCRWVSCVAGAGPRGHADLRPAPPRPRGKVARVVVAAAQEGRAAVALAQGAPRTRPLVAVISRAALCDSPGRCVCRKLQGAELRLGFCPAARFH